MSRWGPYPRPPPSCISPTRHALTAVNTSRATGSKQGGHGGGGGRGGGGGGAGEAALTLIIALEVMRKSVARSFTALIFSPLSAGRRRLSSSLSERCRAAPCLAISSLQVLRSSSLLDRVFRGPCSSLLSDCEAGSSSPESSARGGMERRAFPWLPRGQGPGTGDIPPATAGLGVAAPPRSTAWWGWHPEPRAAAAVAGTEIWVRAGWHSMVYVCHPPNLALPRLTGVHPHCTGDSASSARGRVNCVT